mmetsp:Transcript_43200/g.78947  ORF Transcript_43200/g.78947 Transcript_43200/m.78947 type:complete len:81 (-) Transcript_43200:135-377(-)
MSNIIPRTVPTASVFGVEDALEEVEDAVEARELWCTNDIEDFAEMPVIMLRLLLRNPSTVAAAAISTIALVTIPNVILRK